MLDLAYDIVLRALEGDINENDGDEILESFVASVGEQRIKECIQYVARYYDSPDILQPPTEQQLKLAVIGVWIGEADATEGDKVLDIHQRMKN